MAQFDYSYYKGIHRGDCTEGEFLRLAPAACDAVDVAADRCISGVASPHVLRALCFQLDLLAKRDFDIEKESVGDMSVSYRDSEAISINGIPMSPLAIAALKAGGYLERWA